MSYLQEQLEVLAAAKGSGAIFQQQEVRIFSDNMFIMTEVLPRKEIAMDKKLMEIMVSLAIKAQKVLEQ